jgi:putative oxidoreductase
MPAFTATAISSLEFFGGLLLAIGLFSRLISFVLTINMVMAYVTADKEALHSIFSDPDKFTTAAPYVFLIAALIVFIFGAGIFSVDALADKFFWKSGTQTKSTI